MREASGCRTVTDTDSYAFFRFISHYRLNEESGGKLLLTMEIIRLFRNFLKEKNTGGISIFLSKSIMKTRLSLFALLFVIGKAICLAAPSNEVTVLKIHLKDGSAVTYELGEDARIQFENASMYFSSRNYKFDIPLSDISLWTYAREQASLGNIVSNGIRINQQGDIISISGLEKETTVSFYSVDGKEIYSARSVSGMLNVSVEDWVNGAYIIKAGKSTFKFMKR